MNVKVGDLYIRHSDGKIWKVKKIEYKKVVLESENGKRLALADIFGLGKGYSKKETHPN